MNVLEKILEEIEIYVDCKRDNFRDGFERCKEECCEIIRSHMVEKKNVTSAEIIRYFIDGNPYYAIKFKEIYKDAYTIGYASYNLAHVIEWLNECFEFCGKAKVVSDNDGWIPVEERLPETEKNVLATIKHSAWIADYNSGWIKEEEKTRHPESTSTNLAYRGVNGKWVFVDENGDEIECEERIGNDLSRIYDVVTHWRPLPEPYKPKKLKNRGKAGTMTG